MAVARKVRRAVEGGVAMEEGKVVLLRRDRGRRGQQRLLPQRPWQGLLSSLPTGPLKVEERGCTRRRGGSATRARRCCSPYIALGENE